MLALIRRSSLIISIRRGKVKVNQICPWLVAKIIKILKSAASTNNRFGLFYYNRASRL